MDENQVLQQLRRQKIITIKQLEQMLKCSVITVRRRLKKWKTYTGINKNGRYYTLPDIPKFDQNGLWKYENVLFSKHGNLRQTIVKLISEASGGLSAVEISKLVDLAPNSSFISQLKNVGGVKREKHHGRFIYFSDRHEIYLLQKQRYATSRRTGVNFPTDSEAIVILVQFIKHPGICVEQLAVKVSEQGCQIDYDVVRRFLKYHDLLKKTPDTNL